MVETVVICKNCGNSFVRANTHAVNQIFCSSECRKANRKLKPKITKNCLWCHSEFGTSHNNKKFCNQVCGSQFNNMKQTIFTAIGFDYDYSTEIAKLEQLGK